MMVSHPHFGQQRLAVFIDGSYFRNVGQFFKFHHPIQSYLSVEPLTNLAKAECSKAFSIASGQCMLAGVHYLEGRLEPWQLRERYPLESERLRKLEEERSFEMYLRRCGVATHYIPVPLQHEKGVDVQLALTASQMADEYDIAVLIAGDGDFVPLVQSLRRSGKRVALICCDFEYQLGTRSNCTRTATSLVDAVDLPIHLLPLIDSGLRRGDHVVCALFERRGHRTPMRSAA